VSKDSQAAVAAGAERQRPGDRFLQAEPHMPGGKMLEVMRPLIVARVV
jgi:hypothetical protein